MILVIGGTKGTGSLIVRLLERQAAPVRVLARKPANVRGMFSSHVEVVGGDITQPHTLPSAIEGTRHIIFTAGCRSGHPVGEAEIKATEYEGVRNTLAAARDAGFAGRFLYMTASGVTTPSIWSFALNLYKGKTLVWRRRAEDKIRASTLPYTIIRTGVLLNRRGGLRGIRLTQESLPLSPFHTIPRGDVADAFIAALDHPRAIRTTFEIISDRHAPRESWPALMQSLKSDDPAAYSSPSAWR